MHIRIYIYSIYIHTYIYIYIKEDVFSESLYRRPSIFPKWTGLFVLLRDLLCFPPGFVEQPRHPPVPIQLPPQ